MAATGDPITQAARAGEPDRYLAALFAPEPERGTLVALAALSAELQKVAVAAREPLLADIRLQWWRDALTAMAKGEASGHPVLDALREPIASGLLPLGPLLGLADAATVRDPLHVLDPQALRSHLAKSESALFALAARVLSGGPGEFAEAAAQTCGQAYGLARLLAGAPPDTGAARAEAIARCRQTLEAARGDLARLDSAQMPGFLPLAMTPVYLDAAAGRATAALLPLRRWWRIGRAGVFGAGL